jgi:hypothetical protein
MSDIIEEVKRTPMKHSQKINFVILGLVILASGFALGTSSTFFYLQGQDRIRPRPFIPPGDPNERDRRGFDPVKKWAAQYKFTDEQTELVKAAMERQHQEFRELFDSGQEKMEVAKNMLVEDMNDILTPEQFSAWDKDFKERLKKRWGRGRGRSFRSERGGPPGSRGSGRPPRHKGDAPPGDGHRNKDRDGVTSSEASPK